MYSIKSTHYDSWYVYCFPKRDPHICTRKWYDSSSFPSPITSPDEKFIPISNGYCDPGPLIKYVPKFKKC